jgi:hypothetical protein
LFVLAVLYRERGKAPGSQGAQRRRTPAWAVSKG